jgi:heme A synthase
MREQLRNQLLGTLIFLVIQFLLGMAVVSYSVGLFVTGRSASASTPA